MSLIDLVKTQNIEAVEDFLLSKRNQTIIKEQKEKDKKSKTALMHAVISGNLEIVELLCQEGKIDIAGFNSQDKNGMTSVMHAAKLGYSDILEFFYNIPQKLTNNINKQNFSYVAKNSLSGLNALMLAIVNEHIDCLIFLYCKEIQYIINHQDNEGKTAIMLALNKVGVEKNFENKERIRRIKRILNELFRIIETIFNNRSEECLSSKFNNSLNLITQDKDNRDIFAYAKEAGCEKELFHLITSISIDSITLDPSIKNSIDDKPSPVTAIENHVQASTVPIENDKESNMELQGISVTPLQRPKTNKRPITELDTNDTEQTKIRKRSNNKKVKITFNKPNSKPISYDMNIDKLEKLYTRNTVLHQAKKGLDAYL